MTTLHAGVVVLAAGSLGSTGLLLASRERGLRVSRRLGHHFSSSGDQLGLAYFGELWETYIRERVPVAEPPPP